MYTPRNFREERPAVLHDLMRRFGFATLFHPTGEGPDAVHLPFMFEPERGERGTLVAHMARANPLWRAFDGVTEALVVFLGPHAYVSPAWYEEPEEVPTWNYAAVHVRGVPRIVEEASRVKEQLLRLVAVHEAPLEAPWNPAAAARTVDAQLRGVVAFEIPVSAIEGKLKFNQNRSRTDREGVIAALEGSADPREREVADIMRRHLESGE